MSPVTAMSPALTSAGPVAFSWMRLGPSPTILMASCFTFSTMSVMSSRTPASEENSCSTLSMRMDVTAAPCSEESITRRSALPSVSPKPRSSGSATNVACVPRCCPGFTSSCVGFFRSCQFFEFMAKVMSPQGWARQAGGTLTGGMEGRRRVCGTGAGGSRRMGVRARRADASALARRCAGSA